MKFVFGLLVFAIAFSSNGVSNTLVDKSCVKYSVTVDSKVVKAKIEKEMLAVNGVSAVMVSLEDSFIEVSYSKSVVTTDAIKAKIDKLGLNPQPLKCKPNSSYCDGDCRNCLAVKPRGRR